MTTISELIVILEEIKKKHGDIPVRTIEYKEWDGRESCPKYTDIEEVWFTTDKDEPQIEVNPYADGFVVIE